MTERQPGPGVEQAEIFAHDGKCVVCGAPPVLGVEGIFGGGADKQSAATARRNFPPECADAAGMRPGSDDDCSRARLLIESISNRVEFVSSIEDARRQEPDIARTNALSDQHHAVVLFFTGIGQMQILHGSAGLQGLRQPDFPGEAVTINLRGGQCAVGKPAAEHNDGL